MFRTRRSTTVSLQPIKSWHWRAWPMNALWGVVKLGRLVAGQFSLVQFVHRECPFKDRNRTRRRSEPCSLSRPASIMAGVMKQRCDASVCPSVRLCHAQTQSHFRTGVSITLPRMVMLKCEKEKHGTIHAFAFCHDTIRDAILTCARKPTWVSWIYRT